MMEILLYQLTDCLQRGGLYDLLVRLRIIGEQAQNVRSLDQNTEIVLSLKQRNDRRDQK